MRNRKKIRSEGNLFLIVMDPPKTYTDGFVYHPIYYDRGYPFPPVVFLELRTREIHRLKSPRHISNPTAKNSFAGL
jgi:hypothetical protein